MPSASERFEAARKRRQSATSRLDDFASRQPFALDDFQLRACRALEAGRSVLVAAPTGSGKTVVGQFAVDLALHAGSRAFYTTPIKALSNQKYAELRDTYGSAKVGLLTGDNAINGDAQVVVMTTEVLRNMIYERSSALTGLGHVVMDEVHYLADRSRGAVWEEVLIQLPLSVSLTALSATVSNAEEFGAWLTAVRGRTEVVVEEHRPVPLFQHVMAGTRLYDLFVEGDNGRTRINPSLVGLAQDAQAEHRRSKRTGYQRRGRRGPRVPCDSRSSGACRKPNCCRRSRSSSPAQAAKRQPNRWLPAACGSPPSRRPSRSGSWRRRDAHIFRNPIWRCSASTVGWPC